MHYRSVIKFAVFSLSVVSSSSLYATDYSFVDINQPYGGAGSGTFAQGINNSGQIVGGIPGFTYDRGSYTPIVVPNSINNVVSATAINNNGVTVGYYYDGSGQHGFISNSSGVTTINSPYGFNTAISGINDDGVMVGYSTGAGGGSFIYSNGNFSSFSNPDAFLGLTTLTGINNAGQIVGSYRDKSGFGDYGFVFDGSSFAKISVPGTTYTQVTGINNKGEIVGYYEDYAAESANLFNFTVYRGFLFDGENYHTIINPSANSQFCFTYDPEYPPSCDEGLTYVLGINDDSVLVGAYTAHGANAVGFMASPVPIPSAAWLFGSGLLSLATAARRKNNKK